MNWGLLLIASLFECAGATFLKMSDGCRRPVATILFLCTMTISMGLLAIVARYIPMGTAYAVWTGLGAIGTVIVGIVVFGESSDRGRWVCLTLIVLGVILLRWSDGGSLTGGEDPSVDLAVDIGQSIVAAGVIEGESLVVHP